MPLITTVLTAKGETRKANLTLDGTGTLTMETIQKYMRKKEAPEQVATFAATNGLQLTYLCDSLGVLQFRLLFRSV